METPKKPIKLTELEHKFLINKIKKQDLQDQDIKKYVEELLAQRKEILENKKTKDE